MSTDGTAPFSYAFEFCAHMEGMDNSMLYA
jgi:hypothetical protein